MIIPFKSQRHHIVLTADDGAQWLLDTGAQQSVGRSALKLCGATHQVVSARGLIDLDQISKRVDARLDGLIGMDQLSKQPFTIDWDARFIRFGTVDHEQAGVELKLTTVLGVPAVSCTIGGQPVRAMVDTGAAISFHIDRPLSSPIGHRHEFFISAGKLVEFDTPLWSLEVDCGDRFVAPFGHLPALIRETLRAVGISSILGVDLWKQNIVTFDIAGGRLVIE